MFFLFFGLKFQKFLKMKKGVFLVWWFGMTVHLCLLVCGCDCSEILKTSVRSSLTFFFCRFFLFLLFLLSLRDTEKTKKERQDILFRCCCFSPFQDNIKLKKIYKNNLESRLLCLFAFT